MYVHLFDLAAASRLKSTKVSFVSLKSPLDNYVKRFESYSDNSETILITSLDDDNVFPQTRKSIFCLGIKN